MVITADRTETASEQADFPVFGEMALNLPVGGLNQSCGSGSEMRIYIKDMLDLEISKSDMKMMASDNPAKTLGI